MKIGKSGGSYFMTPDTRLSEISIVSKQCETCFPGTKNEPWTPTNESTAFEEESVSFSYLYLLHLFEVTVTGKHYLEKGCIMGVEEAACANEFYMFAIESADPFMYPSGDGYLGLSLGHTQEALENLPADASLNSLQQLKRHNMIDEMKFGIYTKMKNDTEPLLEGDVSAPSQIRLGGINKDLIGANQTVNWINTKSDTEWDIELKQISFHGDDLLKRKTTALLNPGFPFILAPQKEFTHFKEDLLLMMTETNHTGRDLKCTDFDWCYFKEPCSEVGSYLPPMTFTFTDTLKRYHEYTIPASSFLFEEAEEDGTFNCHLGLVGSTFSETTTWMLGDVFLQNFYVAFDAEGEKPRVSISHLTALIEDDHENTAENVENKHTIQKLSEWILGIMFFGIVTLIIVCGVRSYCADSTNQKIQNKIDLLDKKKALGEGEGDIDVFIEEDSDEEVYVPRHGRPDADDSDAITEEESDADDLFIDRAALLDKEKDQINNSVAGDLIEV